MRLANSAATVDLLGGVGGASPNDAGAGDAAGEDPTGPALQLPAQTPQTGGQKPPVSRLRATLQGAFGGASSRAVAGQPPPGDAKPGAAGAAAAPVPTAPAAPRTSVAGPSAALLDLGAQHARQASLEAAFQAALPIFAERGVKKGLSPLFEAGYLTRSGPCVAHFLRLCGHEVAPDTEVGDFLGDEGRTPADMELAQVRMEDLGMIRVEKRSPRVLVQSLRHEFLSGLSLASLPFDAALRILLTKAGFRLPGEAQKISRLTAVSVAYSRGLAI